MAGNKLQKTDAHEEFMELAHEIETEDPDPEAVRRLRALLRDNPDIVESLGDCCGMAISNLILAMRHPEAMKEAYRMMVEQRKAELCYEHSSVIERLAIDDVVLAYLRLYDVQHGHTQTMYDRSRLNHSAAEYMDRRLIYAQRRYMRALEGLARIRKLTKGIDVLQVNIATDGGQQVNVQNKSK
jgi:hypothetical protein